MTKLNTMTDENPINETQQSGDSAASQGGDANGAAFERLEGAQDPAADSETLDYLGLLGTELEEGAPAVLSSMVRRAVALNPNTSADMMAKLAEDPSVEVRHAVESRR